VPLLEAQLRSSAVFEPWWHSMDPTWLPYVAMEHVGHQGVAKMRSFSNKHGNFNLQKSAHQQPARLWMLKQAKLLRWAVGLAICLVIWVITNDIPD
jgi:hypothetical protein